MINLELGDPLFFPPHQLHSIVALACNPPRDINFPITHWSTRELTLAVIEQKIVVNISHVTISTLLRTLEIKPHRWHYWLNSNDPEFESKMLEVVDLYLEAPKLLEKNILVFSTDEKPGIQALSRPIPSKPTAPGNIELIEHEYRRNGTACLTASFNIATGKVIGLVTPNRPASVFATHIEYVCMQHHDAKEIHFVVDNLNTHYHEEVCRVVAQQSGLSYTQLEKPAERQAFLKDKSKRVVFHFLPKHGSWLNQIEIWLSILSRKLLRRGIFESLHDLEVKILEYIMHWNNFWAHPFAWTYNGKPLKL